MNDLKEVLTNWYRSVNEAFWNAVDNKLFVMAFLIAAAFVAITALFLAIIAVGAVEGLIQMCLSKAYHALKTLIQRDED